MKFQLKIEKSSFLSVAKTLFTYDNPTQEIELDKLDKSQLSQVIYNCRRGLLACENPDKLLSLVPEPAVPMFNTAKEVPIPQNQPIVGQDPLEEDLIYLKKILKGNIPTIKKIIPTLSIGRCRKLKELESKGKSRKNLIASLDKILDKFSINLSNKMGGMDVEGKVHTPGIPNVGSTNVSDIVESEVEKVTIYPSDRIETTDIPDGDETAYKHDPES